MKMLIVVCTALELGFVALMVVLPPSGLWLALALASWALAIVFYRRSRANVRY